MSDNNDLPVSNPAQPQMTIYVIEVCVNNDGQWAPISKPYFQHDENSGTLAKALDRNKKSGTGFQYRVAEYRRSKP